MFYGSIPAAMQAILREHVATWDTRDIYVGCSGNFTVERVIAALDRFRIHGNDVQLYSAALGSYGAGQPLRLTIAEQHRNHYGWLSEYMRSSLDTVATVMLSSRMALGIGRSNAYYDRMRIGYQQAFPGLHQKTAEKVQTAMPKLESFFLGGILEWLDQLPTDSPLICYPPFYAGDYESMYAKISELFDWTPPEYEELDTASIDRLILSITERPYWLFGVPRRLPAYEPFLRGMTRTTNRGVPLYVYASGGSTRIVMPRQQPAIVRAPRLARGETIGDRISLVVLSSGEFVTLRSQFMNQHIRPGTPTAAYAVLVDGKLIGSFAFHQSNRAGSLDSLIPGPQIYLLSDFPVRPTDYPKLSKLVLYAALSSDAKLLAERSVSHRVRSVMTTAFSNRPVSMKYRGLFRLLSRKPNPEYQALSDHERQYTHVGKNMLNYGALMGQWSLQEGLELWKKRYGGKDAD